ncbi:MAG: Clostripain family protein [Methanomassiliicoccales archaeon PtaU1.Bin124]|nr:MAG: Clostripain family protein [Methanomassiliicoccales archaeon PtaU1.Bin124]
MASSRRVAGRMMLFLGSLIFIAVLCSTQAAGAQAGSDKVLANTWTIMVYLDGDNNLEEDAIGDFLEMATAPTTDNVNIVVQMDRIEGFDTSYGDWTGTMRFHVTSGLTPMPDHAEMDLDEVNMADPASLTDFIDWSLTNYPAQNYMLVMWDHGGNWGGVCQDYSSSYQIMGLTEVNSSLAAVKSLHSEFHLTILGFDACIMAGMEICAELHQYTDYFIFSELNEPGYGWNYELSLNWLTSNYAAKGEAVATRFALDYIDSYTLPIYYEAEVSMSVVNSSHVPEMMTSLDALAKNMSASASAYHNYISASRSYGLFLSSNVDLLMFAEAMRDNCLDSSLHQNAYDLYIATSKAIVYSGVNDLPGGEDCSVLHGLGLYMPASFYSYNSDYELLGLALIAETHWEEALHAWFTADAASNAAPSIAAYSPTADLTMIPGDLQAFSVTVSDADPDAIQYYWYLDGALVLSILSPGVNYGPAVEDIGTHTLEVVVWDGAATQGHTWSITVAASIITTPTLTGTAGHDGWYRSDVSVSFSVDDNTGSGVEFTNYSLDGGAWTTYSGSLIITAEGTHTLQFFSHSFDGKDEEVQSIVIKIDQTMPSMTAEVSTYKVWLNGTDAVSGVYHIYYRLDGGSWVIYQGAFQTASGFHHALDFYVEDYGGNIIATATIEFGTNDSMTPTSGHTITNPTGSDGWYVIAPNVWLTGSDDGGSGLKGIYYSIAGGAWTKYTAMVTINVQGTVQFRYYAVDNFGNTEGVHSFTVKVDTVDPETHLFEMTGFSYGWGNATSTYAVIPEDVTSGPASTYYRIDNGTWTPYTAPLSFDQDGVFFIEFYAVDAAGNVGPIVNVTLRFDVTSPDCYTVIEGRTDSVGTYLDLVNVTLVGSDVGSGVAGYEVSLDGGDWQQCGAKFDLELANGTHLLLYRAIDITGNTGATGSTTFTLVHPTDPAPVDDLKVEAKDGNLVLTWTAPDNGGTPITAYVIYRSTDSGVMVLYDVTTNTTYTDRNVEQEKEYTYQVVAANIINTSISSNSALGKVPKPSAIGLDIILILLVVVAAIVTAVLLLRVRRKM